MLLERAKDLTDQVVSQIAEARGRHNADLILEIDLTEPLVEGVPHDPLGAMLARRRTGLESLLDALRRAGDDPRVQALVAKVGGPRSTLSLARAQELRDAVRAVRAKGKLAVAWAETFGELGGGNNPYYLASGFDEVWLQPSGDLCLTGAGAEVPFFRGVLDKVGVVPQIIQRHEYKNAANTFTERGFTPAHREATEQLVASVMEQLVAGVAEGRDLDAGDVRMLVDRAPLVAAEAAELGLVDHLGYRDEVYAAVREQVHNRRSGSTISSRAEGDSSAGSDGGEGGSSAGSSRGEGAGSAGSPGGEGASTGEGGSSGGEGSSSGGEGAGSAGSSTAEGASRAVSSRGEDGGSEAVLLYVGRYGRTGRSRLAELSRRMGPGRPDTVGLVHVTGPIHLGRSGRQPFGRPSAGSNTVASALRAATEAPEVKAIVLRVSSPGGSYVASDVIWRQVALSREAGTPVVVSMGEVAASGGYFVAMGADAIVAEPATITGSIGVVAGKPVVGELAARLGLDHERVTGGRHALMLSPFQEFTDEEWDRLNGWLDRIYDDFVAKVAAGRGLTVEQAHEVARGRVWTGADAADRGLVDHLGGLDAAFTLARERAGLPPSAEVDLVTYPRVPLVARLRPASSSEDPAAASARVGFDGWGTFADLAVRLGLPAHGPLTLPIDAENLT